MKTLNCMKRLLIPNIHNKLLKFVLVRKSAASRGGLPRNLIMDLEKLLQRWLVL